MGVGVEAGHAIRGHFNRVVPVAGVRGGVQDADVGADAADDDLTRRHVGQPGFQSRIEEPAVPVLGDDVVPGHELGQFVYDVGLFGALDAVDREYLELQVVGVVVVGDEKYLRPGGQLSGKQAMDPGYDLPGLIAAVEIVARRQDPFAHFVDEHYVGHFVLRALPT